ncbi:MAG: response regulator transcription factor [Pedobacter sp.]|jgi:DNA-binding NarL/FixJ family response regulator|nr:MAG: response regulator transcription factor [Pedobacter sp.]
MLKILLAEDHNIVRNGIKMLLETESSIQVVGEMINGLEVLEYLDSGGRADIVLTDINMPDLDGISLTREVRNRFPEVKVVILSMHDNEKYISQAFMEGAVGYLLKNISAEELVFSLKHVEMGKKYLCAELGVNMLNKLIKSGGMDQDLAPSDMEFSARELEVLHLIGEGLTNLEMADKLFISKRTVEGHRQSLLDKTGSRNTATLIRYAATTGLLK